MRRFVNFFLVAGVFAVAGFAHSLGVAAASPIIHVHDEFGTLATVNVATGAVSKIGSMGAIMTDIAFSPTGELYGISYDCFFEIDPRTAETKLIGHHNIPRGNALTFSPSGALYAAGSSSTKLYSIDVTTGSSSPIKEMGHASAGDLAYASPNVQQPCTWDGWDPLFDSLYMTSTSDDLVRVSDFVIRIYPIPPAGQVVGSMGVKSMLGLAAGPNHELYGFAGNSSYRIDTGTGTAQFLSSFECKGLGTIYGASCNPVPEPATCGLLTAAIAGIAGIHRRNRRSA